MVKAAAGGGGRGMRLVEQDGRSCRRAQARRAPRPRTPSAIGRPDPGEGRSSAPRHVEIQVFADAHGNVIHLGERDCSVQRRHQKVIEEAPCPVMTPSCATRWAPPRSRPRARSAIVGAGTVEFLLDEDGEFYFLEMNTRLQVEHPVTETVTGLDLVALQLARRARRAAAAHAGAMCASTATPSRCGSTPRTRTPASCRRPAASTSGGRRRAKACASITASRTGGDLALLRSDDRQGDRARRHARRGAPRLVRALSDTAVLGPPPTATS